MKLTIAMIAFCVISLACAGQSVPNKNEWGEKFNSNGATLVLKETDRGQYNGQTVITYNLFASGLPKDASYSLWIRLVGQDPRQPVQAYINKDGKIVNVLADPAHHIEEDQIDLKVLAGKGEPKRFALISDDGQYRAFAEVVPFPIERQAGPCRISAIMLAAKYFAVEVVVTGLQPNEDVQIESQSGNETNRGAGKATAQGTYVALVAPLVKGQNSGTARFNVAAASCKIGIGFPWGDGSYRIQ
jgi:hypothetical protein